jgi:hypothetical protein
MRKLKKFMLSDCSTSVMTHKEMEQITGCKLILACTCKCVGNNEVGSASFKNTTGECPYTLNAYLVTPLCPKSFTYCT